MSVPAMVATCYMDAPLPICSLSQPQLHSDASFVSSVTSPHNEKQRRGL